MNRLTNNGLAQAETSQKLQMNTTNIPIVSSDRKPEQKKRIEINEVKIQINEYVKRKHTAGLGGQLYESKLLTLIFVRNLHNDNIEYFLLGTNMEGIGEFDDIIFRYKSKEMQKSKIIFVQAKHKDDPTRALTFNDIMKQRGDFAFPKYFDSYLKIKQKFTTENENLMFQGSINDVDCEFIIYTPAVENISNKKILFNEDSLMKTSRHGKIFQLKYDNENLEAMMYYVGESRVTMLAKILSKNIVKENNSYNNILLDDLMKTFHVFIAHHVIVETKVSENLDESTSDEEKDYFYAKFRPSFLTSDERNLLLLKNAICKEVAEIKGITLSNHLTEVNSVIEPLKFKLPMKFGNLCFRFIGNEKKQEKRLTYLCFTILKKLMDTCNRNVDTKYFVVKLDDNSIGPGKILLSSDLENYRLGGLIGNLLILDDEIEMLKFNLDRLSLSNDNIKILDVLHGLEDNYDLSKYRFDINITNFPRLLLTSKDHDRELLIDFLDKLKFYTNQAKEDEVENILTKEIDRFCKIEQKHIDSFVRIKCGAIFLKVHDKIQKWWQQPESGPYLTKTCDFYQQAKIEILESPLLNIIHFIYCEKIKHVQIEFEKDAIDSLKLNEFLTSMNKALIILTEEILLSIKKNIQYFDKIINDKNYVIIDFDFMIIENCFERITLELNASAIRTVIIVTQGCNYIDNLLKRINYINKHFKGKLIIITNKTFKENLKTLPFKNIQHIDKNSFSSLSVELRENILRERQLIFQGEEVSLNTVLDNTSLNLINSSLLLKLINKEKIIIGKSIFSSLYINSVHYYLNRKLNRWISLPRDKNDDLCYIEVDENTNIDKGVSENKDIVCITNHKEHFENFCKKYSQRNIHWLIPGADLTWRQTQGSLKTIMKYINRGSSVNMLWLETLKDIQNKIVIITAEPGEGKSTLLTHLAIKTKRSYPDHWILKINLLENIDQFCNWQDRKTKIDLIEAMYFLYGAMSSKDLHYYDLQHLNLIRLSNVNEILLNNFDDQILSELDFSEIKLFNYFYNNNKLAILFDGFDEICPDYEDEVLHLLNTLKQSKVVHLWVTTRPYYVLENLEETLETFSYHLTPLKITEQKKILQNIWIKELSLYQRDLDEILKYVDYFYDTLKFIIFDFRSLMNYPLHIYMIAEIYQNIFEEIVMSRDKLNYELSKKYANKIREASNLTIMYEQFTNKKFYKIRFGDKNDSMDMKHPDTKRIIAKTHKEFVQNHQNMSAYLTLNRNIVLTEGDLNDIYKFIDSIKSGEERTGFIVYPMNVDQPFFVHYTFAEYFAVEFIFNKLRLRQNLSTLWQYLINDLMTNISGIHRFINSKLQEECIMADLTSNIDHSNAICNILTQDGNKYFGTIYISIVHSFEYSATFLLRSAKAMINNDNLLDFIDIINTKYEKYCIFCAAVSKNIQSTVKCLIEIVADVDINKVINLFYCQDLQKCNPLLIIRDVKTCQIIFTLLEKTPERMFDLFSLEPRLCDYESVYTIMNRFQTICHDYILRHLTVEQRVKIFSLKDTYGRLAICEAGDKKDYNFFVALNELIGRRELEKMCGVGVNGCNTSNCELHFDGSLLVNVKHILDKLYDSK